MSKLIVEGGYNISGDVIVSGAKNSILPILAASLLCEKGQTILHNCPDLSDTKGAIEIIQNFGGKVKQDKNDITVDAGNFYHTTIPDKLMRQMRSSIMFLGAILAREHKAHISFPGGCDIGNRPIDLHIDALKKMGVSFMEMHGYLICECYEGIYGAVIDLSFPSVGATENILLAATLAKGTTVINNAAKEPEIGDLIDFLQKAGAKIKGKDTSTLVIEGVEYLTGAEHTIIPDRIVAATYLMASAACGGGVCVKKCEPAHMSSILSLMEEAGCQFDTGKDEIYLKKCKRLKAIKQIRTMSYPGFPTDSQAPLMALMSSASGSSIFIETIFENRYKHVAELIRMGAKIKTEGRVAVCEGVMRLTGAQVECTDLRGGAALVIAALSAYGVSEIENIHHIDRGYEKIEDQFSMLGAKIKRM